MFCSWRRDEHRGTARHTHTARARLDALVAQEAGPGAVPNEATCTTPEGENPQAGSTPGAAVRDGRKEWLAVNAGVGVPVLCLTAPGTCLRQSPDVHATVNYTECRLLDTQPGRRKRERTRSQ